MANSYEIPWTVLRIFCLNPLKFEGQKVYLSRKWYFWTKLVSYFLIPWGAVSLYFEISIGIDSTLASFMYRLLVAMTLSLRLLLLVIILSQGCIKKQIKKQMVLLELTYSFDSLCGKYATTNTGLWFTICSLSTIAFLLPWSICIFFNLPQKITFWERVDFGFSFLLSSIFQLSRMKYCLFLTLFKQEINSIHSKLYSQNFLSNKNCKHLLYRFEKLQTALLEFEKCFHNALAIQFVIAFANLTSFFKGLQNIIFLLRSKQNVINFLDMIYYLPYLSHYYPTIVWMAFTRDFIENRVSSS